MAETRRLAAILVADVCGYSRLASVDEEDTVTRFRELRRKLVSPVIDANKGRVFKRTGDGLLAEFGSVVDAVRGALRMQRKMAVWNADVPPDKRIEFRIGIHLGDVIVESDGDLMGDGVNVAARLEGICEPGGICLSVDAWHQVSHIRINATFVDLGEQALKNIDEPIRAYGVRRSELDRPSPQDGDAVPSEVIADGDRIGITEPRPDEILADSRPFGGNRSYRVSGTLRHLPSDHEIWLLVEDERTGHLWPQGFRPVEYDSKTGSWSGRVNVSKDQVRPKINAVVAPPTSQDFFRYFERVGEEHGRRESHPLSRIPPECINRTAVRARTP
jgi:class 3 adenylate cyclase